MISRTVYVEGPDREPVPVVLRFARFEGPVSWSSRWDLVDHLADIGVLRRVHHGPSTYGHVDYFEAGVS